MAGIDLQGHPAATSVAAWPNRDRLNVKAAPADHARDLGQRAGAVLDED
jgi:hypothetical protein